MVELGSGVESAIGLGTQVVLHPLAPCGTCAACRGDQVEYCARPEILGIHRAGGLATDVVWPAARMVAAPGVDPRHAAILADAVATANRALDLAQLPRGGRLCVLGAGGVGTHVLELARLADPEAVLTGVVRSESSAARLAVAGFDSVIGLDIGRLRHPDGMTVSSTSVATPGHRRLACDCSGRAAGSYSDPSWTATSMSARRNGSRPES